MSQPRFIPWSRVKSWVCDACGECCRWFSVPVTMHEYARISQNYGHDVFALGLGRAYLRRRPDGRCVFQFKRGDRWLCALQAEKPHACKMWPFIVCSNPVHGRDDAARWDGRGGRAYVYVDPRCSRIWLGKPTGQLVDKALPEFVDIAYGRRGTQLYTTDSTAQMRAMETISPPRDAGGSTTYLTSFPDFEIQDMPSLRFFQRRVPSPYSPLLQIGLDGLAEELGQTGVAVQVSQLIADGPVRQNGRTKK
ncbi:YkgJ family cysteine cluster protein [[Eubacterium] cellulosolvens]